MLKHNRVISRDVPRDFHVISRDMVDVGDETEPHSLVRVYSSIHEHAKTARAG